MTKTMNQASLNSRVVLQIIKLARLPNYIYIHIIYNIIFFIYSLTLLRLRY